MPSGGGDAHIVSPAHNIIKDERFNYIRKKLALALRMDNIPNYRDILEPLQNAEYISVDDRVYGVPLAHGPYGLAYNTKYFKTPPESWNILWDKKYIGKYTISKDYYEVNCYITAMKLGYSANQYYSFDFLKSSDIFRRRLKQLAKNSHSFWTGVDSANDLRGMALATTWGFSLSALAKEGEVWKIASPREGTTGWVDNFIVNNQLKNDPFLRRVAEEWMNYILSPEFQAEVVVRQLGCDPVNIKTRQLLTPQEIKKHHLDEADYFIKHRILWPTLSQRHRNGMSLLWKQAME